MRLEPTARPSRSRMLPAAAAGNSARAIAVTISGYRPPVSTVRAVSSTTAGRRISDQVRKHQPQVHDLDARERHQNAAQSVHQQIAPQQDRGPERTVAHTLQGQRDEAHDDERVEN